MKQPRVSILIPVYNRERYIGECIQSAADQSFTDLEIVVIDNASTDRTWMICQDYAARDGRIRIFRNDENIGPVRNWRRCAEEAQGLYSKILFSDDLLESDCVGEMIRLLEDPDIAFVYCPVRIGTSKSDAVDAYASPRPFRQSSSQYLDYLLSGKAPVSPGGILIRTKELRHNIHGDFHTSVPRSYEQHGAGPDVMISLLALERYKAVAYVDRPLVFFRAHPESISVSNQNNEVSNSYLSVLSYYLKNHQTWSRWLDYVVYIWAIEIKRRKRWVNPHTFLRDHEGNGTVTELLYGSVFLLRKLIRCILFA